MTAIDGWWKRSSKNSGMAEYTRPATWDDLKLVARHLNEAEVEYALIGGYATIRKVIGVLKPSHRKQSRRLIIPQPKRSGWAMISRLMWNAYAATTA